MAFLAVLLALGAAQLFGKHPLDRPWVLAALTRAVPPKFLGLGVVAWVVLPTLLVALGNLWLERHLWLLALPFAAGVLWLSFGSTNSRAVDNYINAGRAEDWDAACAAYQSLKGDNSVVPGDWPALNKAVLAQSAYLGFVQIFAVLFWFSVAGPAGALGYRLAWAGLQAQPWPPLTRLVWLLEWPAARLLGLTFAFTGNFLSCIQRWQACVFCTARSTPEIITHYVLGALGVAEGGNQSLGITRRELSAMARLYRRSLWFWVGVLAIAALGGW